MKVITLTLNPAFDVHCEISAFQPYHENLAQITSNDAGGKGINISRALTTNGVDNLAFVLLGEENGADFERALARDGISYRKLTVPGRIRENLTCHTAGVPETRISFAGFSVARECLASVGEWLEAVVDGDTVVTFTGRAPDGSDITDVMELLYRVQQRGGRLVIDSRSLQLSHLQAVKPWLIKPNQEEISHYLQREVTCFEPIAAAAQQLNRDGIANVLVSLGEQGAMLVCEQGVFTATAPPVEVSSTVGAGDSYSGTFLVWYLKTNNIELSMQLASKVSSYVVSHQEAVPPDTKNFIKTL